MSGELVSMLGFLLPMLSSITNHVPSIRYCSKSESNESRDDYLFALACSATCPENDRQSMQEMSMQDLFELVFSVDSGARFVCEDESVE